MTNVMLGPLLTTKQSLCKSINNSYLWSLGSVTGSVQGAEDRVLQPSKLSVFIGLPV